MAALEARLPDMASPFAPSGLNCCSDKSSVNGDGREPLCGDYRHHITGLLKPVPVMRQKRAKLKTGAVAARYGSVKSFRGMRLR